jgi:hypothetical protein
LLKRLFDTQAYALRNGAAYDADADMPPLSDSMAPFSPGTATPTVPAKPAGKVVEEDEADDGGDMMMVGGTALPSFPLTLVDAFC